MINKNIIDDDFKHCCNNDIVTMEDDNTTSSDLFIDEELIKTIELEDILLNDIVDFSNIENLKNLNKEI